MTVEIRTKSVKPLSNSFGHLQRRFGDKPATRYQEATYDIQSTANFHYKPLWDPEREMFDARRTAVTMKDWYALKDPRQFYYGNYTTTRAKQQDAVDRTLDFIEKRDLLRALPVDVRALIQHAIVPLRHYEWGANTSSAHVAAYGYGTAITSPAMMNTMDRLGMAQHISRIGLLLDGNSGDSLLAAHALWTDHADWQGLRREVERMFVTRDWFEVFVAQLLVADALVYPLFFQHIDTAIAGGNGSALSSLTDYLMRWYEETAKWIDAVIKTAAAENADNKALISGWAVTWRDRLVPALTPIVQHALGNQSEDAVAAVVAAFNTRAAKLGLSV
ncbi:aromatic/alkene monooxygenase hydroxylase subunit beta [Nevskia sp.]|uniref:aromatic/alkene monooxygenase hydroxylase subunit beta n=1 Tax=Nevskia sp. TaxID=1929292 RepID=UPI0025DA88BE|nr:aromatic/alkene monooxygenase hydroxylase subunit beta [Nevskia sp.]